MKKILIGLGISLLAVACSQPAKQNVEGGKHTVTGRDTMPADAITLNGLTTDEANLMAGGYNEDANASSKTLSFWLNIAWVDNAYDLLFKKNPEADGIRIYTGMKDGKNTLIITATTEAGTNELVPSGKNHKDLFVKDDAFLRTVAAHDSAEYTPGNGATLYNPDAQCPTNDCGVELTNHISCDTAHLYVQNFMKSTITINLSSEWYSKTLIANIYNELHAALANKVPADGIRIYFGRNLDKRDTFIIVTTKSEDGVHKDYYECYYKNSAPGGGYDHGEICPTSCDAVTWPTGG